MDLASVVIDGVKWRVWIAGNPIDRVRGLIGVDLAEADGMLFVYDQPGIRAFTMRGLSYPLDIAFMTTNPLHETAEGVSWTHMDPGQTYWPGGEFVAALEVKCEARSCRGT